MTRKTEKPKTVDTSRWILLAVLAVSSFFDGLDANIIAVALPRIQQELGTGLATAQWIMVAYPLALAALLITGGRLGDIFGTRRVFLTGLAGFVVSSAVCAVAVDPLTLISGRVGQGAMAALTLPQVMSVMKTRFAQHEWGLASAVTGTALTVGSIGGPFIGGVLTDLDVLGLGWRAVFAINLPIGLVILALAHWTLPESESGHRPRLDVLGVGIVVLAALGLMFPLVQGRELGWPVWTFAVMAASVPLWFLFAVHQKRLHGSGAYPLVPPTLFGHRYFTPGLLIALLVFSSTASFTIVVTYYLQLGLEWSPTQAAWAVAAVPIGITAVLRIAFKHGPARPRLFVRTGSCLAATGTFGLGAAVHVLSSPPGWYVIVAAAFVVGCGVGLCSPVLTVTLLGALEMEEAGAGAGVINTTTQFGSALGIAVIGAVFGAALGPDAGTSESYSAALGLALACGGLLYLVAAALTRALARTSEVAP